MDTTTEAVRTALMDQPDHYVLHQLGAPFSDSKLPGYTLRDATGRELALLDAATVHRLVREGTLRARPYAGEGVYRFDLSA